MKEPELLSKKDLLSTTGISYGQLYRWKRQKLIPDNWFIKQSSFTGQETFFPKEKIMQRITIIMKLKDEYSLDDLAKLFNPEMSERLFRKEELGSLASIDERAAETYRRISRKEQFTFVELVFLELVSRISREFGQQPEAVDACTHTIAQWTEAVKDTSYTAAVCRLEGKIILLLHSVDGQLHLDSAMEPLRRYSLEDISKSLNEQIRKQLGDE